MKISPPVSDALLDAIVMALRSVDSDLVAVVVFGSAVYAPDFARDIDLLVISKAPKEWERYLDAASAAAKGLEVDVVVKAVGEKAGKLAGALRAFGRVLFGEENWLWEVTEGMPVPSFDDARRTIGEAEMDAQEAMRSQDAWHADSRWRSAFNWLFEASRRAAMAFLSTEENRWGLLRGQLPQPFQDEFHAIVNMLHLRFWYEGNYPRDNPEWHFQTWRDRVAQFIADLEGFGQTNRRGELS